MVFAVCVLLAMLTNLPDDPAEALVSAQVVIEQQEALLRSFDVKYAIDIEIRNLGNSPAQKQVLQRQTFHEQRRGDRYRRLFDLVLNANVSKDAERDLQAFDGSVYQVLFEARKEGVRSSEVMQPTGVINTIYFSNGPLGELLTEHKDDSDARWEEVGGARLLAISWEQDGGNTRRTYYLDPAAAYQPRRYTMEQEYPDGYFPDGRKSGIFVGDVKEYFRQDGVVWPKVVRMTHDYVDANGREFRTFDKLTRIESLIINPELDDAVFQIDFPAGTTVTDKDRGVVYVAGQPGSERPLDVAAPPATLASADGGLVYEPWADWRLWLAAGATCAGLLLWLKRREAA